MVTILKIYILRYFKASKIATFKILNNNFNILWFIWNRNRYNRDKYSFLENPTTLQHELRLQQNYLRIARCTLHGSMCMLCSMLCVDVPSNTVDEAEQRVPEDEAEVVSGETAKDLQEAGKE